MSDLNDSQAKEELIKSTKVWQKMNNDKMEVKAELTSLNKQMDEVKKESKEILKTDDINKIRENYASNVKHNSKVVIEFSESLKKIQAKLNNVNNDDDF